MTAHLREPRRDRDRPEGLSGAVGVGARRRLGRRRGGRRRRGAARPAPARSSSGRSTGCSPARAGRRRRAAAGMGHRAALGPDVVDRVLDDVERRRFLVEPAREDPLELALRVAHVELDEGAGQLLRPPRARSSRRRAAARSRRRPAPPGPACSVEFARQAVALVEQAEHRDPLAPSASCPARAAVTVCGTSTVSIRRIVGLGLLLLGAPRGSQAASASSAAAIRQGSARAPSLSRASRPDSRRSPPARWPPRSSAPEGR